MFEALRAYLNTKDLDKLYADAFAEAERKERQEKEKDAPNVAALEKYKDDPLKLLELATQIDEDKDINRAYQRLIVIDPNNADYLVKFGMSVLRWGCGDRCGCPPLEPEDEALAIKCLEKAIEIDPGNLSAHKQLAETIGDQIYFLELEDMPTSDSRQKAIEHLRRVVEISPYDSEPFLTLSEHLLLAGLQEEAEVFMDEFRRLVPANAETYRLLSRTYSIGRKHEEALQFALKSKDEAGQMFSAWSFLSQAYASVGDVENAVHCIRKAKFDDAKSLEEVVAGIYFRAKQYPEAIESYERALLIAPTGRNPNCFYFESLFHVGREKDALEYLNKRIEEDPIPSGAYHNLALFYFSTDRPDIALHYAYRAEEFNPDDTGVQNLIAGCLKLTSKSTP